MSGALLRYSGGMATGHPPMGLVGSFPRIAKILKAKRSDRAPNFRDLEIFHGRPGLIGIVTCSGVDYPSIELEHLTRSHGRMSDMCATPSPQLIRLTGNFRPSLWGGLSDEASDEPLCRIWRAKARPGSKPPHHGRATPSGAPSG